jgi:hypothetical protein
MFAPCHHGLVLNEQWHRDEHAETTLQAGNEHAAGRAGIASDSRDHDRGIDDESHASI